MDDEGIYITFDSNRFLEVYDVDQKDAEEMLSKPFSFADLKNIVTPKTVIW